MTFIRTLLLVIIASVFYNCSSKSFGGLTKEEYKSWKQQKKEMSPVAFKALIEDKERLTQENLEFSENESNLEQKLSSKDKEIDNLSRQLANLKRSNNQVSVNTDESTINEWEEGVVFKVQLAAFDDFDLRGLSENGSDLKIIDQDGYIKYVLGQFRDYNMADQFKKKLRKIGVKEAWIVPYKDGQRVALKDVLTEVID